MRSPRRASRPSTEPRVKYVLVYGEVCFSVWGKYVVVFGEVCVLVYGEVCVSVCGKYVLVYAGSVW
jgi:hypothetical protein